MDYELIDCGDLYKVERFGKYIITRPEPQAMWALKKTLDTWKVESDAFFERKKGDILSNREDSGNWVTKDLMPNSWIMDCGTFDTKNIQVKLALTSFKHVGIFPEQQDNWNFLNDFIHKAKLEEPEGEIQVLNLFAYTGMASLVSAASGAKVVHVDSVKQVVNWSNENRLLSGIEPKIAWVIEDAIKYIKREITRGKKYNAIILDPPAYGRGPNGEKWILEKELFGLLSLCKKILKETNSVLIINLYSLNITPVLLENILKEAGIWSHESYCLEQYIPYLKNRKLPLGVCARCIY